MVVRGEGGMTRRELLMYICTDEHRPWKGWKATQLSRLEFLLNFMTYFLYGCFAVKPCDKKRCSRSRVLGHGSVLTQITSSPKNPDHYLDPIQEYRSTCVHKPIDLVK
jgi:hypothetical protein